MQSVKLLEAHQNARAIILFTGGSDPRFRFFAFQLFQGSFSLRNQITATHNQMTLQKLMRGEKKDTGGGYSCVARITQPTSATGDGQEVHGVYSVV